GKARPRFRPSSPNQPSLNHFVGYHECMNTPATLPAETHAQTPPRGTGARHGTPTALVRERVEFLLGVVGGAELARWLGVSRSQPTRWRSGAEQPGVQAARALVDLDHVVTRALMLWAPRVATDWLTSSNAYLDGARPLDVLQTRG